MDERRFLFSLSKGISRSQSSMGDGREKLWDSLNVINRGEPGATILRAPATVAGGATPLAVYGPLLPFTSVEATPKKYLIQRTDTAYIDLLGNSLPAIAHSAWLVGTTYAIGAVVSHDGKIFSAVVGTNLGNDPTNNPTKWLEIGVSNHSMSVYRDKVIICQSGVSPQMVDLVASTVTELTAAPKGSLCAEYGGRLWIGYDTLEDSTDDTIDIPLSGIALPIPVVGTQGSLSGTDGVTTLGSSVYKFKSASKSATFAATEVGKVLLIGSECYNITAYNMEGGSPSANSTYTLAPINGKPEAATGLTWQVLSDLPLVAYPGTSLDLGTVFIGNDSGARSVKVFNKLATKSIKITAIRIKGAEFRSEDLPSTPVTIPPGGSISVSIIGSPEGLGARESSITFDHDFYAQGSLSVALKVTGSNKMCLASPSCLDFGSWPQGTATPYLAVQIQNPLPFDTVLKDGSFSVSTANFANDTSGTPFPVGADYTLGANSSKTYSIKFCPGSSVTGDVSATLHLHRRTPAKQFRWWYSMPGDPKTWRRDIDWVDLVADGGSGGLPIAALDYDNSLYTWKERGPWAMQSAGQYGYRGVQLTLGKGIGCFGQGAVCGGGGSVWFAGPSGVYRCVGPDIKKVSQDLDTLWRQIPEDRTNRVLLTWYGGLLCVVIPQPDANSDPASSLWIYDPGADAWSRTEYNPYAIAGTSYAGCKQELYAVLPGTPVLLRRLDYTEGVADIDWSITTPYITMGPPGQPVSVERGLAMLDTPSVLRGVKAETTTGGMSMALLETVASVDILRSGIGIMPVANSDLHVDEGVLDGLDPATAVHIEINGTDYDISSFTPTTIVFETHTLPVGLYLYRIKGTATDGLRARKFWLPDNIYGEAFRLTFSGKSVASKSGKITGFVLVSNVETDNP